MVRRNEDVVLDRAICLSSGTRTRVRIINREKIAPRARARADPLHSRAPFYSPIENRSLSVPRDAIAQRLGAIYVSRRDRERCRERIDLPDTILLGRV